MQIIDLQTGLLDVNCYIVYPDGAQECMVIDPGGDADAIMEIIKNKELRVEYILLTHGHFDHIGGVAELKELTGAKVLIHTKDAEHLTNGQKNMSFAMGMDAVQVKADIILADKDILDIDGVSFYIIHTPGHTMGSICVRVEDKLFTGDTLFEGSVGRTDLPGGNQKLLNSSIHERLLSLKEDYYVYPGHGGHTTLAQERKSNPFLR